MAGIKPQGSTRNDTYVVWLRDMLRGACPKCPIATAVRYPRQIHHDVISYQCPICLHEWRRTTPSPLADALDSLDAVNNAQVAREPQDFVIDWCSADDIASRLLGHIKGLLYVEIKYTPGQVHVHIKVDGHLQVSDMMWCQQVLHQLEPSRPIGVEYMVYVDEYVF